MNQTPAPYELSRTLRMYWVNPENPTGARHQGGQANHGRKGMPCRGALAAGETWVLGEGQGCGTIRRFWITLSERHPEALRGVVLRIWWDGAATPAVEAPLGDFFCQALGQPVAFSNRWFNNPEGRNWNCTLPMPFRRSFKIAVTNESPKTIGMFWYHFDYTLGDAHGPDTGYLHAWFNRENPTTLRRDYTILPAITGRGRYLGACFSTICDVARYGKTWWGEGEVKVYLDGDRDFPTLCGTGTEDYICTSWGQGKFALPSYGCHHHDGEQMRFGYYRLHDDDPIHFQEQCRISIQQIGWGDRASLITGMKATGTPDMTLTGDGQQRLTLADLQKDPPAWNGGLFERQDDWASCAWFYLAEPAGQLPPIAPYAARVAGLLPPPKA